jgi:hypothetical protein
MASRMQTHDMSKNAGRRLTGYACCLTVQLRNDSPSPGKQSQVRPSDYGTTPFSRPNSSTIRVIVQQMRSVSIEVNQQVGSLSSSQPQRVAEVSVTSVIRRAVIGQTPLYGHWTVTWKGPAAYVANA